MHYFNRKKFQLSALALALAPVAVMSQPICWKRW